MLLVISNSDFQTAVLAWIGTGLIVVTALLAAAYKILPELTALWAEIEGLKQNPPAPQPVPPVPPVLPAQPNPTGVDPPKSPSLGLK